MIGRCLQRSTATANSTPQRRAAVSMAATSADPLAGDVFFLDAFAQRQWDDPSFSGTRIIAYDKAAFVAKVHELYRSGEYPLVDGYAPFCKHLFVPNFVGAQVGALRISGANRHLLRSGYARRRPEELAVLTRWFLESDVAPVPQAAHLDLILYSREQLVQEYRALPSKGGGGGAGDPAAALPPAPWGIISVKAQDEAHETPMQPITMMRNALGVDQGGSGVALQRGAYEVAAEYWQQHAAILGDDPEGPGGSV